MRSLFVGMIMLSASVATVGAAQAQTHHGRLPGYEPMQAHIAHQRPAQNNLQPTRDELETIDRDNQQLDLPASQDGLAGAGPLPAGQDALTTRIEQDNPRLDVEIRDICPSCGAENSPPVRQRSWPIHNGFNHQPTRADLRALHQQEFTRDQAEETDQLYDQLMSSSNQIMGRHPGRTP